MSGTSKIEWTDATWNPIVGCTKCSPGCLNCYAERMAKRQVAMGCARGGDNTATWEAYSTAINPKIGKWSNDIRLRPDQLDKPLNWKEPRRIFVCSMSDLFHPKVPFGFIDKVYKVMREAKHHTFQVLTKRPKVLYEYCEQRGRGTWPKNVHIGVSISNQAEANEKIPILLQIPAAVRWLSVEPLLSKIDLTPWLNLDSSSLISWVVVGGESGPGSRQMHPNWVRSIRDQCVAAGVPFFFKQWGKWGVAELIPNDRQKRLRIVGGSEPLSPNTIFKIFPENENSTIPRTGWVKVGKKKAGRILDGREWNQLPERR